MNRFALLLLTLALCLPPPIRAATYDVRVASPTTLTNGTLPYAVSGRYLGATAIGVSGLTNLLVPGYVTLGNTTNRISDDGSNLTRNGVAIGGGGSGDVVGPASATDNAIVRFDGATGTLIQDSLTTMSDAGAFTFSPGVRQTFSPDATTPGFNVGSPPFGGDPSTPINGDLWYDSTLELLRARINGSTISLGAGGSGGDTLWHNVANAATLTNTMQSMTFFHDVAAGDDPDVNFDLYAVMDSATFNDWGDIYMVVSTNNAQLNVLTTANNTDSGVRLISGDSSAQITAEVDGSRFLDIMRDTLFFESQATDNATNVALVVDTVNPWTVGALIKARTDAVDVLSLAPNGRLALLNDQLQGLSRFGVNAFSTNGQAGAIDITSFDDNPDGPWTQSGSIASRIDPSFAYWALSWSTNSAGAFYSVEATAYDGTASISISDDAGLLTQFQPTTPSTGSAVAHFLDTSNVLTNGDSLFQVRNTGVTHFRVAGNSGYGGAGTKFLTDDGTYQTASSSSVITYTNQFIYNSKVTYNADVYVTNSSTIYINGVDVRTDWQGGAASDETTALTVTTNAWRVQLPYAATLLGVYASVTTPQASGSTLTLDLKESGVSMFSTLLTIDNTEYGMDTAAVQPVISDTAIAQYAPLVWSITQVGTPPAGLKVWVKLLKLL